MNGQSHFCPPAVDFTSRTHEISNKKEKYSMDSMYHRLRLPMLKAWTANSYGWRNQLYFVYIAG